MIVAFALAIVIVMQGMLLNRLRRIMVDQAKIDASVARLTAAVDKIVAAQGAQTPDATVNAALDAVDVQSARVEALVPAV